MKVKVFAKLNLSLNVFEKQGEFHPIDSVVTSVDVFDVVTVKPLKRADINVKCDVDIPTVKNSAYRAAVAFQKTFGVGGCEIGVKKGIPLGAGLGGSSADAAAVVYCLCKLNNIDTNSLEVQNLCSKLGSDVNFMLQGGFARMTGKGDNVEIINLQQNLYFAVTTFPTSLSSAEVYSAFDVLPKKRDSFCDNRRLISILSGLVQCDTPLAFGNMLQPAACSISDWAGEYLDFCVRHKLPCTMTGSGSAFFVPCTTKSDATVLAKWLNSQGFATQVCHCVPCGIKRMLF